MPGHIDKEIVELINNFFLKAVQLILQSKTLSAPYVTNEQLKNNWFRITTLEDPSVESQIKKWITFDGKNNLPPLVIETFLDIRELTNNHSVVLGDQDGNPWNVCKGGKKTEIVLERWLIELESSSNYDDMDIPDASELYKQLVLLFRYLHTLTRLLPAGDLHTLLSKSISSHDPLLSLMHIGSRILDGSKPILSKGRVGLSKNIIATYSNVINETNIASHLEQRKITPIKTAFGLLRITVSYRKDCDFHVKDSEEILANQPNPGSDLHHKSSTQNPISTLRRTSVNSNRSMSISPQTTLSPTSLVDTSPQKKSLTKLQPFKVGSISSGSILQGTQGSGMTRNPSSSSVAATLRAQRSSNGSATIPIKLASDFNFEPSSIGSGSISKYSSSFDKVRRHSITKRSDGYEKQPRNHKMNEPINEDLLDFIKLLENKQELNIKKLGGTNMDISNSLIKFQSMRLINDTLSDDLSMSVSLDPNNQMIHEHRSGSHSPTQLFSHSTQYSSIPLRLSHSHNNSISGDTSMRNSVDKTKTIISNRLGGHIDQKRGSSIVTNISPGDDEDDDLLMNRSDASNAFVPRYLSVSPKSVQSISSSISKSHPPFKHVSNFSIPTTMATPAHAKLHKASVSSSPDNRQHSRRKDDINQMEDDDLLFFMSDMNLSK